MTTLPLPTSPGRDIYNDHHTQMRSDNRPRAETALSYVSNRSRRSSGSGAKLELIESSKDKKRLHTKADPSVAIHEQQPAAVALEEGNLDNLRLMQHRDSEGNIIMDPDRSNPTRPRMERPLDTIRSFQAAAEGTSSNRRSTYAGRPQSQFGFNNAEQSRRSSYYGAPGLNNGPQSRPRPGAGGYYRNQSYGFRPDSFVEESPGSAQQWPHRNGMTRNLSAPMNYPLAVNSEGPSPTHSHQQSYETMTSGSDENNKSTNPSSQNSSFDQLHMLRKPGMEDAGYDGQNGYNGNFSSVSPARGFGTYGGPPVQNGNYGYSQPQQGGPMPPPKPTAPNNPRVPIKLGGSPVTQEEFEADFKRVASVKRKSWFSRKFSKGER